MAVEDAAIRRGPRAHPGQRAGPASARSRDPGPELARATSTFLCVPLTSNMARLGLPGTRGLLRGDGGLSEDSVALCFHLRSIDRSRFGRRLGSVKRTTVELVVAGILEALGVDSGR